MDRPILVTGTPRGGKSRLVWILSKSPEFVFLSEPLTIWDPGHSKGRRRSSTDDRLTDEDATPDVVDRIRRMCSQEVERQGGRRYIDDLSYHALRIPFVKKVMPEAKIIHAVRHPHNMIPEMIWGWTYRDTFRKAVARRRHHLSLRSLPRHAFRFLRNYIQLRISGRRRTWGPRVPGIDEVVRSGISIARIACYQWCEMVRIALDDLEKLPQDQWMQVRREDLLADPGGVTASLAEFAEIEDPDAAIRFAESYIDPNFKYDNRVPIPPEDIEHIDRETAPLLKRLGYEVVS